MLHTSTRLLTYCICKVVESNTGRKITTEPIKYVAAISMCEAYKGTGVASVQMVIKY